MNRIKKTLIVLIFGALAASPPSWAEDAATGPAAAPVEITGDGEILRSIEADTYQIISEITAIHGGQMEDGGAQLAIALDRANAEQLQAARDAASVDELDSILLAAPEAIGDLDNDYTFTPVTPCRIVDTRLAGGNFTPGQAREYYVYGSLGFQGGATCNAPLGEPVGVALNVTAVGTSGNGNLVVYPSNVLAPTSSLINYRTGVQNVANAASLKSFSSIGPPEIEVKNNFGFAHVIIDVLGYYYVPVNPIGVEYAGGNQTIALTATEVTVRSISVTTPEAGFCVVNASGFFRFSDTGLNAARCSITTGTTVDFNYLIIDGDTGGLNHFASFSGTRGYSKPAGTHTYNLVCDEALGNVSVDDTNLTATCSRNKY